MYCDGNGTYYRWNGMRDKGQGIFGRSYIDYGEWQENVLTATKITYCQALMRSYIYSNERLSSSTLSPVENDFMKDMPR